MTIVSQSVVHPAPPHAVPDAGPRPAADRRSRPHLRELCDEVLASFRLARDRDPLSDGDRQAAHTVLAALTPSLRR